MKDIKEIISFLTTHEKSKLEAYYKLHQEQKGKKKQKLFELMQKEEVQTDHDAARLLYDSPPNKAYAETKSRLLGDMINLLHQVKEKNVVTGTEVGKALECRKLLSFGGILLGRGSVEMGTAYLKDALKIAKVYEFESEAIMATKLLAVTEGFQFGKEASMLRFEEAEALMLLQSEIMESNKCLYEIVLPSFHQRNQEHKIKNQLKKAIKKIKVFKNYLSSPHIMLVFYHLEVYLHQVEFRPDKALSSAQALLKHTQNEKALKCDRNLGLSTLQLATAQLQNRNYEEAHLCAGQCCSYLNVNGRNYLQPLEVSFLSLMQLSDIKSLDKLFAVINRHPVLFKNVKASEKWNLYKAYYLYLKKDYKSAAKLIHKHSSLLKDSYGWLVSYKLLEIYNTYAMGDHDSLDLQIDAMQKLHQRHKSSEKIIRLELITKVICELKKQNYDFKKTEKSVNAILSQLSAKDVSTDVSEFLSSEVIPFEVWFNRQLN